MKTVLWILVIFIGTVWMISVVLFMSTDLQILGPEEQKKLKDGKSFWEWSSPYGSLNTHYIEKGEGSNHIVLIHGFRAHSYSWRYLIDPLSQAGYHVWTIDLIGYGLSDKPDQIPYNVDFFVQHVKAFMDAKGITKAHLVGNSMGGGVALKMAISHPHHVCSMTLLSALGYPVEIPLYLSIGRHISHIWPPFLGPRMVRHILSQIVFDKKNISDEQVEAYCMPYRLPGGVLASILTLQQFDNQYFIEMAQHYPTLPHPSLIIWGEHDSLIPMSHYEKFQKDFPKAQHFLFANCGHIPQEETPQEVLNAMLLFLQKIESVDIP
jgi:pimeloyl-ACP methyl ester carboxylesterase